MINIKTKLYVDFDNTVANATKRICQMYNEDFNTHPNFIEAKWYLVDEYDFSDQCMLLNKTTLMKYFENIRFFNNLEYMDNAYEVIQRIKDYFNINIVSMGSTINLALKNTWLRKNLPFINFIGCDFNDVSDKSHIDMSDGGILIDDVAENLDSSNAKEKIVFGDIYQWNFESKDTRMYNWTDLEKYLMNKI